MARRPMGELEGSVMDTLWDRGGWRTPGEVHELLPGGDDLAYSTVLTVLIRLWKKGRLERRRDGKAHAYRPVATREDYAAARMGEMLASADRRGALTRFVAELSASDRAQLRRALARKTKRG
ncbi:MAG: BlaI/MecI/CopY family transcriptional regulator [Acidimicrobiales bacterium]